MTSITQNSSLNKADQSIELTSLSLLEEILSSTPETESSPVDFFIATAGSAISEEINRLYQKYSNKEATLKLLDSEIRRIDNVSTNITNWRLNPRDSQNTPYRSKPTLLHYRFKSEEYLKEIGELKEIFTKIKADLWDDLTTLQVRIIDSQSLSQKLKLGYSNEAFVLGDSYPKEWPCQIRDVFKDRQITVYNDEELKKIRTFYSDYTSHLFSLRLMHISPLISKITLSILDTQKTESTLKNRRAILDLLHESYFSIDEPFVDFLTEHREGALALIQLNHTPVIKRSSSLKSLSDLAPD
ncbi:MAG: hypothetical protein ACI9S8_001175 [Chlamydiales bacterium]|jgi:hypothetical protein